MVFLNTTATGVQVRRETELRWIHFMEGTNDTALVAVVAALDSETPRVTSATFSGATIQNLDLVATSVGVGGDSYPNAYVFVLGDPLTSGTVSGTITVQFDEIVSLMNGISAVFGGVDAGNPTVGGSQSIVLNTEPPAFDISQEFTTLTTGSIVVDVCFAESSNHNVHSAGPDQITFGDYQFNGPRFTATYRSVPTITGITMTRSGVGGPYAAVSHTLMALRSA